MFKWFVFLLLGYLAWRVLTTPSRRASRPMGSERMLPCTRCGLNIPESEALMLETMPFCCRPHLESWQRNR